MAVITVEETIHAPVDEVFARASDVRRWAEQVGAITRVEVLDEGPDGVVGVGTRFRETRVMFGREATEEMTFAEFDPPRKYVLVAASHGSRYRTMHLFDPVDTPEGPGTRLTMRFEATPVSLGARLLSPMFVLMKGGLVKCLRDDLADLKRACEGVAAPV